MNPSEQYKLLIGYEQHGARFDDIKNNQAIGLCPFCNSKKPLFFVDVESLVFHCKKCDIGGNFNQFLEEIHAQYQMEFRGQMISDLASSRGIRPQTLRAWGFGWSGSFFSIPVNGNSLRRMTDLKRYYASKKSLSTKGSKPSFIVPKRLSNSQTLWLMEGEWDGLALWECLRQNGEEDDVYCAPGARVLPTKLIDMFYNKDVIVVYDADEAGIKASNKVYEKLNSVAKTLKFVHWPLGSPDGFDFRDFYHAHEKDGIQTLKDLRRMLRTVPPPDPLAKIKQGKIEILDGTGLYPDEVEREYRSWLSMKTSECLDVMFGTIFANRLEGDPLWTFLVAAPGGMKSELIMSLAEAPKIVSTTSLTPSALISGATMSSGADPSLIPLLNKKVLAIKDFTTILSMNMIARDEIFGIFRDAYDGQIEKKFGTGTVRRYKSKFGIIAGVTPAIEALNAVNTSLGERFIRYKLRDAISERDSKRAIKQALLNIKENDKMRAQLASCGKEVLNWNTDDFPVPDISDNMLDRIVELAQWVSRLRGIVSRERYTGNVLFKPMTEVGTRLAKQLCKLAYGIAIYHRQDEVTEDIYRTIVRVAQDTIPDRVEEVVRQMYRHRDGFPHSSDEIAHWSNFPNETTRYLLQDLNLLKIVIREPGRGGGWKINEIVEERMELLGLYSNKPSVRFKTKKRIKVSKRRKVT